MLPLADHNTGSLRFFLKRALATSVTASLVLLSPGLGCYQALGQAISVKAGVRINTAPGGSGAVGAVTRLSPSQRTFIGLSGRFTPGLTPSLRNFPSIQPAVQSQAQVPMGLPVAGASLEVPVTALPGTSEAGTEKMVLPDAEVGVPGAAPAFKKLISDPKSLVLTPKEISRMPAGLAREKGRAMMDRILGRHRASDSSGPGVRMMDFQDHPMGGSWLLGHNEQGEASEDAHSKNPPTPPGGSDNDRGAKDPSDGVLSPVTSAGQFFAGVIQVGAAVASYFSAHAYLGLAGWVHWAAIPMFGLSAALALGGAGFIFLGARIALSRAGKTESGDLTPMKPPYKFFNKGGFRRIFRTPVEGALTVYITEAAARPLRLQKKLRKKYNRFTAYVLQGAANIPYVIREIVGGLKSVAGLGRLMREMFRGNPEVAPFVKKRRKSVYTLRAINIFQAVIGVGGSYVVGALVDAAIAKTMGMALIFAGITITIALTNGYLSIIYEWIKGRLNSQVLRDFRVHLFGHILRLPFSFFTKEKPSEVASRLVADVGQLSAKNINIPVALPYYVVMAAVSAVMMAATSLKLALILAAAIPIIGVISLIYGNKTEKLTEAQMNYRAAMISKAEASLTNLRDVRGFSSEEVEEKRYADETDDFIGTILTRTRISSIYNGVMGQLYNFAFYLAVLLPGLFMFITTGAPSIGQTMAMVGYAGFLRQAMSGFMSLYTSYRETSGSAKRILDYLKVSPAVTERPDAVDPGELKGEVSFKDVSVFLNGERAAVADISFSVTPGQSIALVGDAESGKSVILDLMLRLHDPNQGSVEFDGLDARTLILGKLRSQVAMLHDEGIWLEGTIRENLLYGLENGASREAVAKALAEVGADFINDKGLFPDGADTVLEEEDWRLTDERKRVLEVARALLSDPGIVLLDRPMLGLDFYGKRRMLKALRVLRKGRTTFVVDDSLGATKGSDLILVMDKGRIVERGTHEELLAMKGRYYKLWQAKTGKNSAQQ